MSGLTLPSTTTPRATPASTCDDLSSAENDSSPENLLKRKSGCQLCLEHKSTDSQSWGREEPGCGVCVLLRNEMGGRDPQCSASGRRHGLSSLGPSPHWQNRRETGNPSYHPLSSPPLRKLQSLSSSHTHPPPTPRPFLHELVSVPVGCQLKNFEARCPRMT